MVKSFIGVSVINCIEVREHGKIACMSSFQYHTGEEAENKHSDQH